MSSYTAALRYLSPALIAGLLLVPRPANAAVQTYDVNAWIDTTDYLYIHGSTLQWEHTTSGSPAGTHSGPEPTIINTTLDGVAQVTNVDWNQTWPDPLPADAFSSVFTPLSPALPTTGALDASVIKVSGRGTPTILQQPTAANNETLIVQFTDGSNGAAYLDAQITVVPEPMALTCIGAAALGLLHRKRRIQHQAS